MLLRRAYRKQKRKSWQRIAKRYGLANKARAFMIANGQLRPNPIKDACLMRAVSRELDAVQHPKAMLRFIRKVAIPFLESRQRSRTRLYLRGGKPWEGW